MNWAIGLCSASFSSKVCFSKDSSWSRPHHCYPHVMWGVVIIFSLHDANPEKTELKYMFKSVRLVRSSNFKPATSSAALCSCKATL